MSNAISPRITIRLRLARWVLARLIHLFFRVRLRGAENIPSSNYIAQANHLLWIDPFLLFAMLPAEPRVYFIGANQAVNRGWKAWLMKVFDVMIPFERGARWVGREVFDKPLEVLKGGAALAFFPEGDSGHEEGRLMPLQRGIGHIILQANYPIIPMALSGTLELYWRKELMVTIGKPFRVSVEGLGHREAIDATVEQVAQALRAVLPRYQEPVVKKKRLRGWLTTLLD
jgi:1-acyl-sn-glycerol-3-phosphate acyltransferase